MKLKYYLILTIIFLMNFFKSFAQDDFKEGFVVTSKGDTLLGLVYIAHSARNYESCRFKTEESEKTYKPIDIKGFGFMNDKYFASGIVENSFVEVLVEGTLSVYRYQNQFILAKREELYRLETADIEKEVGGKVMMMPNNSWRNVTTYLVSDCLTNAGEITKSLEVSAKSFTKLAIQYNECDGQPFRVYRDNKSGINLEYGFILGGARSGLKITDQNKDHPFMAKSYSSVNPTVGVAFALYSAESEGRLAFQGEIHLSQSNYSGFVEEEEFSNINLYDTYIDVTSLSIPLSIKLSTQERSVSFFGQVGVSYDQQIASHTEMIHERVAQDEVFTYKDTAFKIRNGQVGIWAGAGVQKSSNKFSAGLMVRYFQLQSLDDSEALLVRNNRIGLSIILLRK